MEIVRDYENFRSQQLHSLVELAGVAVGFALSGLSKLEVSFGYQVTLILILTLITSALIIGTSGSLRVQQKHEKSGIEVSS